MKIEACACNSKYDFICNEIEIPGPVAVFSCSVLYHFFDTLVLTVALVRLYALRKCLT